MRKRTFVLGGMLAVGAAHAQQPGILTRSYDNDRSGWNPHETALTQGSIAARGLSVRTTIPVWGDARGVEAQPLILPGVKLANGSTHDVLFLCSMANNCRGVDAWTGADLWDISLGRAIDSSPQIDAHQVNQHWGALATGVIDPATGTVYQTAWISTDGSGSPASGRYFLFAIRLKDGSYAQPPLMLQGTDTSVWKMRSSLLLFTAANGNKTVCMAHGSVYEISPGFTGGVTCVDVPSWTLTTLPVSAGIWMGGQGMLADAAGNLYAGTGNGDFDPAAGFYGESFLKFGYTPPGATAKASVQVTDDWSPYTDFQRTGQPQPASGATPKQAMGISVKPAGMSAPSEQVKPVGGNMSMSLKGARVEGMMSDRGQAVTLVYPTMATGGWSDEDLWSGGGVLIEALGMFCGGGKDGILYCTRMANLGHTQLADLANPKANCAKLAVPPVFATAYVPADPCPGNAQALNFFPNGDTAHMHSTPVRMWDPLLKSWVLFVWGENNQLHKWAVSAAGLKYVAQSNEFASADVRGTAPGGMPGGFCTGSSNGDPQAAGTDPNSMLLFCSIPYGDANAPRQGQTTQGRLLVYDPIHLAPDGSLKKLWDSQDWGIAYTFNKFLFAVVWNGQVYLPNYSGGVVLLGN